MMRTSQPGRRTRLNKSHIRYKSMSVNSSKITIDIFIGILSFKVQVHSAFKKSGPSSFYSNRANLAVVENKGAKPYIEFRKNAKPGGKNDAWNRLYHTYSLNREDFYQHYHKRSNVESTFAMIKT